MSSSSPSVSRGWVRPQHRLAAVLLPAGLLASGCDAREVYESTFALGFPDPVTEQGQRTYDLWLGSVAAAAVVGLFVTVLIMFAVFRYRKRSEELPAQIRYNLPVEVLYTVVPFVIIAVLFYYTTVAQNFVNKITPEDEGGAEINIGVVGFQWNWTFRYDDEGVQTTGSLTQPAQLVIPVGKRIRFLETSPDVIHSFFVPAFLFKRDVVPGRENSFELTPNKTGEYIGRCAELCGEKHSAMNFSVRVVEMPEYEAYVASLQQDPKNQIGSGVGQGRIRTPEQAAEQIDGIPST